MSQQAGIVESTSTPDKSLATVLLLAPESQLAALTDLVSQHADILARYHLVSFPDLAAELQQHSRLSIASWQPAELETAIATNTMLAVVYLLAPEPASPPLPDVATISRLCSVHNIPCAFNVATANPIISSFMQTRVTHLIFNPVAGQRDSTQDLLQIRQALSPWMHLHIHFTSREVDADQLAQQAIAAQPDLIIASGGDGTVSLVASQMLGTGIPLGVIPRGTANALSVAMGIPTTVAGACKLIVAGTTRRLDAAYCNQQLMTLLAGVGLEAGMVGRATRELKNQWGVLAYLIAGWEQLGQQELFNAELDIDGQVYTFPAFAVTVANAAPPTSVLAQGVGEVVFDDGLLDITIITKQNVQQPKINSKLRAARDLINLYGSALVKTKAELPNLYHFRAEKLTLKTTSPEQIVVDGEMVGNTPLEVSCLPAALTVVAPAKRRPNAVEKVAGVWVNKVFPSVSTLIAAIGVTGLIGLPFIFWLAQKITTELLPAQTEAYETQLVTTVQQWSTPWLDQLMLWVSRLGGGSIVIPVFCIVLALLLTKRRYWQAFMVLLAFVGGWVINVQLFYFVEAARQGTQLPVLNDQVSTIASRNFLQGTVLYSVVAYLLALAFPKFNQWFYGGAVCLVVAIAFSRLYLGMQWPFDILAGLVSGLLWAMICIVLLRLQTIRSSAKRQKQQMLEEMQ
jgi:diacylglycerol kinase (ATP)